MPDSLTPEQRSQRARIAAHALHSQVDSRAHTEAARAASPGQLPYWRAKVDPGNELTEAERDRRAESARKAHFQRLSLKSSRARSARAAAAA